MLIQTLIGKKFRGFSVGLKIIICLIIVCLHWNLSYQATDISHCYVFKSIHVLFCYLHDCLINVCNISICFNIIFVLSMSVFSQSVIICLYHQCLSKFVCLIIVIVLSLSVLKCLSYQCLYIQLCPINVCTLQCL